MKKFEEGDLLVNRIRTHPSCNFYFVTGSTFYNYKRAQGQDTPQGYVSLFEQNVDRAQDQLIYPFTVKDSSLSSFRTISQETYDNYAYGDVITGYYPLTSSVFTERYSQGTTFRPRLDALRNITNRYTYLSHHYAYSSSLGDKGTDALALVEIPSIFYGSSIKKGSVVLKMYTTGTLLAELRDWGYNGCLIETTGSSTGSIAGTVLYNEGFILLTGSWAMSDYHMENYMGSSDYPQWRFFGANVPKTTYELDFLGKNYVDVITMFCHAEVGELNHSNNPTFISSSQNMLVSTGSTGYFENDQIVIKNIVKSPHDGVEADFKKTTYISKIAILDEDRNVIAIAKTAVPVKKTEEREFTFKVKIDI